MKYFALEQWLLKKAQETKRAAPAKLITNKMAR